MADASLPRIPSGVEAPLVDGYAVEVQRRTLDTPFDSGARRMRNLTRRPWYEVPVRFRMTRQAYAFWVYFFQTATSNGTAWCVIPLAGPPTAANPTGWFDAECRMKEAPKDAPLYCTGAWDVQTRLEVRNWPVLTDVDVYAFVVTSAQLTQYDIDINRTIGHA